MTDTQRVHPQADSPPRDSASSSSTSSTYVIQIPKDQIYRIPPPENEYKFKNYTRQSKRRSRHCHCCCCWTFSVILSFAIISAIAIGVFYLIIRPQAINYSIESLTFSGFNLASSSSISPRIDVVLVAENPNERIGIEYRSGGYAAAYYKGLRLCDGALPVFRQPKRNVTVIETVLGGSGSGLVVGRESRDEMAREVREGSVPLRLNVRYPVRMRVGDVMTWTITVKVRCDVAVDRLAAGAKIVSKSCEFGVKLW